MEAALTLGLDNHRPNWASKCRSRQIVIIIFGSTGSQKCVNMHWKGVHNSERDFTFKQRSFPESEPFCVRYINTRRSRCSRGLRRRPVAARLLESRVRIPQRQWLLVSWCVGTGPCNELITSLEDVCVCVCVCVCDLETSKMGRPRPHLDCCTIKRNINIVVCENSKSILDPVRSVHFTVTDNI